MIYQFLSENNNNNNKLNEKVKGEKEQEEKRNNNNNNNDNNNDDDDDDDDEDFTQDDFFQDEIMIKESPLAPVLIVLDFDHTIAVNDEDYFLENSTTKHVPSTYTRPFMYQFLDYIKCVNVNNVIILWTAGTGFYIKQNLLLLGITPYFNHILYRKHCNESEDQYGKKKSHRYLINKFPMYKNMRSILIDNFAWENGNDTGYSEVLSLKPYCLIDIKNMFYDDDNNSSSSSSGGDDEESDITLVNVILFLQKRFFNYYFQPPPPQLLKNDDDDDHVIIIKKNLLYNADEKRYQISPLLTKDDDIYLYAYNIDF